MIISLKGLAINYCSNCITFSHEILQNNGLKLHVIFNFLDFDFLLCITGICMMGTLDKLIGSIIKLFVITNKFSENLTSETQVHLDFQAVSFCP